MDGIVCVRIVDSEVQRILVARLDTEGIGAISEEYIKNQISVTEAWFRGNKLIKTFNEFELMNIIFSTHNIFMDCSSLESIRMPYNIDNIPANCFRNCVKLNNIVLRSGIKNINNDAFSGCIELKNIKIPDTVTHIGSGAFMYTRLEFMDLPASVTEIGSSVFNGLTSLKTMIIRGNIVNKGTAENNMFKCWENCTGLESFVMLSEIPMGFGFWMMNNTTCKIYVPDTAVDVYKTTNGWSSLASRIYPLSEYKGNL